MVIIRHIKHSGQHPTEGMRMSKIKCISKVECENCHNIGLLQIFLDRNLAPKYGRIRHTKRVDGKVSFTYCQPPLDMVTRLYDDLGHSNNMCNVDLEQPNLGSISNNKEKYGAAESLVILPESFIPLPLALSAVLVRLPIP
jgi:hypothetical protein